ncbi:FecCD family ABC transporter permease [Agrilactobacillus composti]|nr:iron ABC transporter permease [Agrilactobacillus composti]
MIRVKLHTFQISLIICLVILMILNLLGGIKWYGLPSLWADTSPGFAIIWQIRFPRMIAAVLVGAMLAVAGQILQTVSRNPIADPSLHGINSGANLALIIGTIVGLPFTIYWRFGLAIIGALITFIFVMALSMGRGGMNPTRLILSGTVFSGFLNGIAYGFSILTHSSQRFRNFLVGGFSGTTLPQIGLLMGIFLLVLLFIFWLRQDITMLALDEKISQSLGNQLVVTRIFAVCVVVLATAISVAIGGNIAFIGLGIPHLVRFFDHRDFQHTFIENMLLGGAFLSFCDFLSKTLTAPYELPLGACSAALGGLFLIWYVRKDRRVAFS